MAEDNADLHRRKPTAPSDAASNIKTTTHPDTMRAESSESPAVAVWPVTLQDLV